MVDGVVDELAEAAPIAGGKSKLRRLPGEIASWRLAAFSAPTIPVMGALLPTVFLLPPMYTGELGMSLATWGLVTLLSRVFDIVVDPFIGIFCDSHGSRWGRRRHWLVLATPILMLGAVLLFMPQLFVDRPGVGFAVVATIVLHFGCTLFGLNHSAWAGELSSDYHERTRIMGWRGIMEALAPLATLAVAAVVEHINPDATNGDKLRAVTALVLVLMPLALLLNFAVVGERPGPEVVRREKVSAWAGLRALAGNTVLLRLLAAFMLQIAPAAVMMSVNIFYVTFVLQARGLGASLLLIPFACALISVPIWMRIAKGREKHKVLATAYVLQAIITSSLLFVGPGDIGLYVVQTILMGLCSGTVFLIRSILTDIVDTDIAAVGEPRTGTFFAVLETSTKLGPSLVMAAIFPLLQAFGFDPTGRHNTPESIAVVKYVYALAPTVPILLAAAIMWRFPLGSAAVAAVRARLEADAQPAE